MLGSASTSERFTLKLALAAPVEELEGWLDTASPQDSTIYAVGIDLPRESAAVKLARDWAAQGKVSLTQRRDPDNRARWQYLMQKRACGAGGVVVARNPRKMDSLSAAQSGKLLNLLRLCAERGQDCPSNMRLARALGLPSGDRGRGRARYLLDILVETGAVVIESHGCNAPRVVTIIAEGRASGLATRKPIEMEPGQ